MHHAQKAFYFCQKLIMIFGITAQWRTWEGILRTAALFISFIVTVFVRISREFRMKQYAYEVKQLTQWMQRVRVDSGSDLPIGYSLGPQDPMGPPQTVIRIASMASVWSLRLNFVKNLCLNYYSGNLVSFNFRGDNTRVFQRVSIRVNLNMTVGQAKCQLLCRYTHSTLAASCICWIVAIAWLYEKNLWLFMFEMHLISGITDEPPPSPLPSQM